MLFDTNSTGHADQLVSGVSTAVNHHQNSNNNSTTADPMHDTHSFNILRPHQDPISDSSVDLNGEKHNGNQVKGIKRKGDTVDGLSAVLSAVAKNDDSYQSAHISPATTQLRCSFEKCNDLYMNSHQIHTIQHISNNQHSTVLGEKQDNDRDDGGDDDDSCDGEEYEYSTILAKILNEKKLVLSKSPSVAQYLQNLSCETSSL